MKITDNNLLAIGDNCPDCLTPNGPVAADRDDQTVTSTYSCDCGTQWTTSRSVESYIGFDHATDYNNGGAQ